MTGIFNGLGRVDENLVQGFGLTVSEVRGVARTQLAGSVVAGILIAAVAVLIGIQTHSPTLIIAAHNGVQQSVFVAPADLASRFAASLIHIERIQGVRIEVHALSARLGTAETRPSN